MHRLCIGIVLNSLRLFKYTKRERESAIEKPTRIWDLARDTEEPNAQREEPSTPTTRDTQRISIVSSTMLLL